MDSFPTNQILCVKFSMHKLGSQGKSQPRSRRHPLFPQRSPILTGAKRTLSSRLRSAVGKIQQPKSHSSLIPEEIHETPSQSILSDPQIALLLWPGANPKGTYFTLGGPT